VRIQNIAYARCNAGGPNMKMEIGIRSLELSSAKQFVREQPILETSPKAAVVRQAQIISLTPIHLKQPSTSNNHLLQTTPSRRHSIQIFNHMTNFNPLPIRSPHHILPPTPLIPTPLIQLHPTQRRPHLQPIAPLRLLIPPRSPRLAVPHHHSSQALAGERGVSEDGADAGAVGGGVALGGHAQGGGRVRAAVKGLAEGPVAAGGDCGGGGEGVEDVVCS
jgi:hypothetical protein